MIRSQFALIFMGLLVRSSGCTLGEVYGDRCPDWVNTGNPYEPDLDSYAVQEAKNAGHCPDSYVCTLNANKERICRTKCDENSVLCNDKCMSNEKYKFSFSEHEGMNYCVASPICWRNARMAATKQVPANVQPVVRTVATKQECANAQLAAPTVATKRERANVRMVASMDVMKLAFANAKMVASMDVMKPENAVVQATARHPVMKTVSVNAMTNVPMSAEQPGNASARKAMPFAQVQKK